MLFSAVIISMKSAAVCCSFPPAATSFILQEFSQYGTILKHVVSSIFSDLDKIICTVISVSE